jgi:hypothetical protein
MPISISGSGIITGASSFASNTIFNGTVGVTGAVNTSSTLVTASRGISNASVPAGGVIQVVQTVKTDTWSSVGTTWTDVTGLSVSITPTSSTSKILIVASVALCSQAFLSYLNLLRGSTNIAQPSAGSGQLLATGTTGAYASGGVEQYNISTIPIHYLDSPATTASTTYKIQARCYTAGNYVLVNRNYPDRTSTDYDPRVISTISAMEIAQ